MPELEKGEIPVAIKYDFNALAWSAAAKEKGINTRVVIPGVSVYGPSALMINRYNTVKADLAKLLLDFALADEAQTAFAEFGLAPFATSSANWSFPTPPRPSGCQTRTTPTYASRGLEQGRRSDALAESWDMDVLGG